jgi:hypothetical protein
MAGKYSSESKLLETKASSQYVCHHCSKNIFPGDLYYKEQIEDRFLHSLHIKRFCSSCFEEYGDRLLSMKKSKKAPKDRTLNEF